jgi:hypothetical protein
MKTIAIVSLLSLSACGVYAQGTINFFNDFAGKVVTEIYSPNPLNPTVEVTGNQTTDTPAGTTTYAGMTAIGGSSGAVGTGAINYANGNNFSVSLYALGEDDPSGDGNINANYKGTSTAFSSLLPVTTYTSTMSTSSSLAPGFFVFNNPVNDPGIPNSGWNAVNGTVDNTAALSLVAWYNAGGTITSYAQASTTLGANGVYGHSTVFVLSNLGEPGSVESNVGAGPTPAADMVSGSATGHYLTTFSLIGPSTIPEPSTIALGVMGVFGFLARRRKK